MKSREKLKLSPQDAQNAVALAQVNEQLNSLPPLEILQWAVGQYPQGLVHASSFGAEDMVIIDMLTQLTPHPGVFYLDTNLLFAETYNLIEEVQQRYGFAPIRVLPELTVQEQELQYGPALWARDPDQCCYLRKVAPLKRFLADKSAWITGIRRDQTPARRNAPLVGWDESQGLPKINPLAAWTQKDVFRYLVHNQVPYNPLHDQGYPSIGCVPCTKPINAGEDARSGRWAGQEKTECGLHL